MSRSSGVLAIAPSVRNTSARIEFGDSERTEGRHQSIASARPGGLSSSRRAHSADELRRGVDQRLRRRRARTDAGSPRRVRWSGTRSSGRGSDVAGRRAVRGCGLTSGSRSADARGERAQLGDRDRGLAEELEQQCLELVVGSVDLVDQQDRRGSARDDVSPQDGPLQEELLGEQVGVGDGLGRRLGEPDRQQLALIVPLVQRLADGDALVALQPDQRASQRAARAISRRSSCRPRARPRAAAVARADREEQCRRQPSSTR